MKLILNPKTIDDYRTFLAIKRLPSYKIRGCIAEFADEYAERIGVIVEATRNTEYDPPAWMFDYQKAITKMAIAKGKFSVFVDPGYGKTAIIHEFALHALRQLAPQKKVLIVSPLMVVQQTIDEATKFYGAGNYPIEKVHAHDLQSWLDAPGETVGITNYQAITDDLRRGRMGALLLDESSMLKSHYGKWGTKLIDMAKGIDWKLCCTGTPAPNDRIEYGNHSVIMDVFPNVNAFLAKFFVNRGQTSERWELKQHALRPFYLALSHWAIFMNNPATYGWHDNAETIPPIFVHQHEVPLTPEQERIVFETTGTMFADKIGGITSRSVLSQIAKGSYRGKAIATHKPDFIKWLLESWPDEHSLVWCKFNAEQDLLARHLPNSQSIDGQTPMEKRMEIIQGFKAGQVKTLISKAEVLGFGLNLQVATRQIFSACDDSYEDYYQCVKRSNRVGSTKPLNVHIPVTDIERPLMENVLRKARMVQQDTEAQEEIFHNVATGK